MILTMDPNELVEFSIRRGTVVSPEWKSSPIHYRSKYKYVELRFNARLLVTDVMVWIPMKTPIMSANRENNVSTDATCTRKLRLIIG